MEAKTDPWVITISRSYPSTRHNGSPALHLIRAPSLTQTRNSEDREHVRGASQMGKGALECPVSPLRKRGQLKGYSGNELTLTRESVQRVCLICKKYLLSYLEMTSELPRPPLSPG